MTPDLAKEVRVPWFKLQPPRAIPIPPQHPGLHPPLQVTAAWSKLMPRIETASLGPSDPPAQFVNLRFPADWSGQAAQSRSRKSLNLVNRL